MSWSQLTPAAAENFDRVLSGRPAPEPVAEPEPCDAMIMLGYLKRPETPEFQPRSEFRELSKN